MENLESILYLLIKGARNTLMLLAFIILVNSCSDDDKPSPSEQNFTVTIENVFESKSLIQSGTIEALLPGESTSFEFEAGKAQYLSLATMITETNDAFISFAENGILLYDDRRVPLDGDIAVKMKIYDAGSEVNEAPGLGTHQGSTQLVPNTGLVESNNVRPITEVLDGFSYPKAKEILSVEIKHSDVNNFKVTLTNTSSTSSLTTPLSSMAWAIHGPTATPIFSLQNHASEALERLAEDGDVILLNDEFKNETGLTSAVAGGAYSIGLENQIFRVGETAGEALEILAEDGIPSRFDHVFNVPFQASSPRSIIPGEVFQFSFIADQNELLSLACMLFESNDWFVGVDQIPLFIDDVPISGDLTSYVRLYDAGTERDEYPGAGNTQGVRQAARNTGIDEMSTVRQIQSTNQVVPPIENMIRISITSE